MFVARNSRITMLCEFMNMNMLMKKRIIEASRSVLAWNLFCNDPSIGSMKNEMNEHPLSISPIVKKSRCRDSRYKGAKYSNIENAIAHRKKNTENCRTLWCLSA